MPNNRPGAPPYLTNKVLRLQMKTRSKIVGGRPPYLTNKVLRPTGIAITSP